MRGGSTGMIHCPECPFKADSAAKGTEAATAKVRRHREATHRRGIAPSPHDSANESD